MKNLIVFILLLLPLLNSAKNPEKEVKSEIKEVSVFLNGAMITRTADVSVPSGISTLILKNISSKISRQTIKASFTGGVKLLSVEYLNVSVPKGKQDSARLKKIEDTLKILEKDLRRISYLNSTYSKEKEIIDSKSANSKSHETLLVAEIQKLSDLYKSRVAELNKLVYQLSEDRLTIEDLKYKLNTEINRIKTSVKMESYYEIRLIVKSAALSNSNLTLSYVAGAASWAPKYDIKVEGVDKKIKIDYMANVANQTGEDWE
ncbi:MAG: DUF4140 domain-containing protein, partial [Bacteroidia bacterium]|nr:DUF4140 domain-containing protein [Bacteroidia bacterium]